MEQKPNLCVHAQYLLVGGMNTGNTLGVS